MVWKKMLGYWGRLSQDLNVSSHRWEVKIMDAIRTMDTNKAGNAISKSRAIIKRRLIKGMRLQKEVGWTNSWMAFVKAMGETWSRQIFIWSRFEMFQKYFLWPAISCNIHMQFGEDSNNMLYRIWIVLALLVLKHLCIFHMSFIVVRIAPLSYRNTNMYCHWLTL